MHCKFLTESQGAQDWRTLRNFVMTSTVYMEMLSALKHVDMDDEDFKASLHNSCSVLNMRSQKPIVETAPEAVHNFLTALLNGSVDTSNEEWVKNVKYLGKPIASLTCGPHAFFLCPHTFSLDFLFVSCEFGSCTRLRESGPGGNRTHRFLSRCRI
jgi:hypothetical protein